MPDPYLFIFGRTPELAFAELQTFFPDAERVVSNVALVKHIGDDTPERLMDILGGTTKIAQVKTTIDQITPSALASMLAHEQGSVEFGISYYGMDTIPKTLTLEVKKELESIGLRARYVTPQHGDELSTVVVDKRHLQEVIIVKTKDQYLIGATIVTQHYEDWNKRDYGRPCADPKAGMLPPKVARMVVNLAGKGKTLLDPFCGMGTILAEGYLMGWVVYGSDSSIDAVTKATKNMEWLGQTYPDVSGKIGGGFVSDAVHVSQHLGAGTVDAVVTEPYMGSTRVAEGVIIDIQKVKNILKGLEKLYIGCLKDWLKVLVSHGKVAMALPEYDISGKRYSVKKVIDMCENLGYTIVVGPIAYHRPQAVVKRQFYVFEKKE